MADWRAYLRVFALACTGLVIVGASQSVRGDAPPIFLDDFNDGDSTADPVEWQPRYKVFNGRLRVEAGGSIAIPLVADSQDFADVSITTKLRLTELQAGQNGNPYHFVGLVAGSRNGDFLWAGMLSNGELYTGLAFPYVQTSGLPTPLNPRSYDVWLQMDRIGDQILLWAWSESIGLTRPTKPQITWTAPRSMGDGSLGLLYNPNEGAGYVEFDFVDVRSVPEPAGFGGLAAAGFLALLVNRARGGRERI